MCNWKDPVDDAREHHWTTSQAESGSTPEAIEEQEQSDGSLRAFSLIEEIFPLTLGLIIEIPLRLIAPAPGRCAWAG